MRTIESTNNETIKRLKKLESKKYRSLSGLYMIEGGKNVADSLNSLASSEIDTILVTEKSAELVLGSNAELGGKVIVTTQNVLSKISSYDSASQMIVFARQCDYSQPIDSQRLVYLDRIRDPGNLGTIIRTAVATDFGLLLSECCDVFNPKVIRSCMSALAKAKIRYASHELLSKYRLDGYKIIGADAGGEDVFCLPRQKMQPFVIAIGNEAQGLSAEVEALLQQTVAIPMQNMESLNASVAAGMLMLYYRHVLIG